MLDVIEIIEATIVAIFIIAFVLGCFLVCVKIIEDFGFYDEHHITDDDDHKQEHWP